MKTLVFTTQLLLIIANAFAQPGTLDITFNGDGKVKSFIDNGATGKAVAIQSDGKIVAAGTSDNNFILLRYNVHGHLDNSFGSGGVVIDNFNGIDAAAAYGIAIQSDGKIIVAGRSNVSSGANVALARFKTDGTPDNSFGTSGKLIVDFTGGDYDYASSVAIQPDGKIVISVIALYSTNYNFALMRLKSNGIPDNNFGTAGKVVTDFGINSDEYSQCLALQPDGKIVVAGTISDASRQDFVVARYKPNGTIDNNFGTGGKATTDFYSNYDDGAGVAVQPNGKIIVTGDAYNGSDYDFAMARYKPNGLPDLSFDGDGKVTTDFSSGSNDECSSIVLQPNGKIILAGLSNNLFGLARYQPNGFLDAGFGTAGKVTTDFFETAANANSVTLQSDGKIVAAGGTYKFIFPGPATEWIAVARYNGGETLADNLNDNISANLDYNSDVIKISPNPFQSILTIEFNKDGAVKKTINIYDINGKLLIAKAADINTQIDVKQLRAGTYIVKINDESGKIFYNGQVIKQ